MSGAVRVTSGSSSGLAVKKITVTAAILLPGATNSPGGAIAHYPYAATEGLDKVQILK